jgi:uncharacterized protein YndB with AHSA1/START domain
MRSRSEQVEPVYISPKELAKRWQCARSSVNRVAQRAGLSRVCLGEGKNGMVRFIREEVIAYENNRRIKPTG